MKSIHFSIITLFACAVFLFVPYAIAQDYTTWKLPEGAKARFGKGLIKQMQYSPDGMQLAVATDIGVWIYDAWSGGLLHLLTGHSVRVNAVVYSPDGTIIASADWNEIRLWDVTTGQHITTFEVDAGRSIAYSPDGRTIASGSNGGPIHLWDIGTRQVKTTLRGHADIISSIAYSPDGNTIATACRDHTVRLWNATTGEHKATLSGHKEWVVSVAYSPDGSTIVTASLDDTVRLWDAATGKHKATLKGHHHYVNSAVYSPDGKTIASRGWDGVFFWDLTAGETEATIKKSVRSIDALAYSPDGKTIALAKFGGTVRLWDAGAPQNNGVPQPRYAATPFFSGHKKFADCLAYSPDGKTIVSGTSSEIHLWNATTRKHDATFKGATDNINSVAYSPDGKTIVGGSWDGRVHLWDAATGRYTGFPRQNRLKPAEGPDDKGNVYRNNYATSTVYSPDGKTIASAIDDDTVHLWDTDTGEHKTVFIGHTDIIYAVAFSPDGKTIASASKDKTVRLWDTDTGIHKATLIGHNNMVYAVAYSPDGKTIATGSSYNDNTIRLWDADTGRHKNTFRVDGRVHSIVFSPDGKTIAVGAPYDVVTLWDTDTGKRKNALIGHKGQVEALAFSPDGKTIASASMDGTMFLWDLDLLKAPEVKPVQLIGDINGDGIVSLWDMATAFFHFIADIVSVIRGLGRPIPLP